ncbi:hypothetical protein PTSG_12153 [Salpingoeca rosetta]|uniref:Uncharacterized protein n=1 Tax=Salpingoeca rosetta (strain ATCC 50818 / BSB-021) TaxID=946362 RepID=F2U753_SALR5|nr:uncharacterized protein PTSG_12153 [Salpingoeca rosetta]EGD83685.1 hypothetical protein PTSG_12153 [Salpingoeca rosetta]|eukprot:XP_004995189.1 hypothetical protein PTSG_12153 [Salpingoeca rosetta]
MMGWQQQQAVHRQAQAWGMALAAVIAFFLLPLHVLSRLGAFRTASRLAERLATVGVLVLAALVTTGCGLALGPVLLATAILRRALFAVASLTGSVLAMLMSLTQPATAARSMLRRFVAPTPKTAAITALAGATQRTNAASALPSATPVTATGPSTAHTTGPHVVDNLAKSKRALDTVPRLLEQFNPMTQLVSTVQRLARSAEHAMLRVQERIQHRIQALEAEQNRQRRRQQQQQQQQQGGRRTFSQPQEQKQTPAFAAAPGMNTFNPFLLRSDEVRTHRQEAWHEEDSLAQTGLRPLGHTGQLSAVQAHEPALEPEFATVDNYGKCDDDAGSFKSTFSLDTAAALAACRYDQPPPYHTLERETDRPVSSHNAREKGLVRGVGVVTHDGQVAYTMHQREQPHPLHSQGRHQRLGGGFADNNGSGKNAIVASHADTASNSLPCWTRSKNHGGLKNAAVVLQQAGSPEDEESADAATQHVMSHGDLSTSAEQGHLGSLRPQLQTQRVAGEQGGRAEQRETLRDRRTRGRRRRRLSLTKTLRDLQQQNPATQVHRASGSRQGTPVSPGSSNTDETVLFTPPANTTSRYQSAIEDFLHDVGCWPTPYLSHHDLHTLTLTEVFSVLRDDDDFALLDRTVWRLSGHKQGHVSYTCREAVLDVVETRTGADTVQELVTAHLASPQRRLGFRHWPRVLCIRANAPNVTTQLHICSFSHPSDPDVYESRAYALKGLLYSDAQARARGEADVAALDTRWVDYTWWRERGEVAVASPPSAAEYVAVFIDCSDNALAQQGQRNHDCDVDGGGIIAVGGGDARARQQADRTVTAMGGWRDGGCDGGEEEIAGCNGAGDAVEGVMGAFADLSFGPHGVVTPLSRWYRLAPLQTIFYEDVPADASLLVHIFHACLQHAGACVDGGARLPSTPFAAGLYTAIHRATVGARQEETDEVLTLLNHVLLANMDDPSIPKDAGVAQVVVALSLLEQEGDTFFMPLMCSRQHNGDRLHAIHASSDDYGVRMCSRTLEPALDDVARLSPVLFVFCNQPTQSAVPDLVLHGRRYQLGGAVRTRADRHSLVLQHGRVWRRMDRKLRPVVWRQVARYLTSPASTVHLFILHAC